MSHSRRYDPQAARQQRPVAGHVVFAAGALVFAALVLAPWAAGRLARSPLAPAAAAFVTLVAALYFWFRRVQRTRARVAAALALAYAALAGAVLWVWFAR
jgi:FtsH-binding integral membrane protein